MSDWVRFHVEIRRGDKRGLPRVTRFVYMELSQEARKRRGWIDLPLGMSDVDGVCEILGGNRREVVEALKLLTATVHPQTGEPVEPMVQFGEVDGKRALIVIAWEYWNPVDRTAADRQRDHRKKVRNKRDGHGGVTRDSHDRIGACHADGSDPRAHALISSPSPPSESLPEERDPEGSTGPAPVEVPSTPDPGSEVRLRVPSAQVSGTGQRTVSLTDVLPEELRQAALIRGMRPEEVELAWQAFCGHYDGRAVPSVAGWWQRWCAGDMARAQARGGPRGSPRKTALTSQLAPDGGPIWKERGDGLP